MVVMQALFEHRKRKFIKRMEEEQDTMDTRWADDSQQQLAVQEMQSTRLACDKSRLRLKFQGLGCQGGAR
eukprot:Skav230044  [mRNA]  locus=scaffold465:298057:299688:+ [translate_table: standard]